MPSGWFDGTSDDSYGMYACIYCDPDFSCGCAIQSEVVQEVLADLKTFFAEEKKDNILRRKIFVCRGEE